ncbi:MAG: DVU0298 family protein [Desulfatiglandales bacterium]
MPASVIQGGRALKKKVFGILSSEDLNHAEVALCRLPPRRVINPLFGLLNNPDQEIRWAAVIAFGAVVTNLADQDLESARVIMRRIMWNLNDESGGMGWGLPEAMGEILARNEILAGEYATVYVSYADRKANYLEHEGLQRGLLWGLGRLAEVRPQYAETAVRHLLPYLDSADPGVRGHAARLIGLLRVKAARPQIESLMNDQSTFQTYVRPLLVTRHIRDVATEALRALGA